MGIASIPARDEADELVALMLAQLLKRFGYDAHSLAIGTVADMLKEVSKRAVKIVCVFALPQFALGQARSLCKQLRAQFPGLKIILGLWKFEGGAAKAQERVGASTDMVSTTLEQAILQVGQLQSVRLTGSSTDTLTDSSTPVRT